MGSGIFPCKGGEVKGERHSLPQGGVGKEVTHLPLQGERGEGQGG